MNESTDDLPSRQDGVAIEVRRPQQKAPKKRNLFKSKPFFLFAVVAGVFLAAFGGNLAADYVSDNDTTLGSAQVAPMGEDGNRILSQDEIDIAAIAEAVSPSVVSITTETSIRSYYGFSREGAGTGVIVSKDGYILTNKHVVDGASSVKVVLENGDRYDRVKVVGSDPLNDIAFLKIDDVSDLPVATLGNSSTVQIGQAVVAIGNSLGQYQNTVTSGIISGTNRPVAAQSGDSIESLTDLIQTDAAINPGNSGGPLVNMSGQVIGINTAIATNAEGIGFAIPINATKGMLKGLLDNGVAERSYLGVSYIPLNAQVAADYELSVDSGAYVYSESSQSVAKDGPAEKAGIKDGDIIVKVDKTEVGTGGGVATLIGAYAPGDKIKIALLRDGRERVVEVTLGAYPD